MTAGRRLGSRARTSGPESQRASRRRSASAGRAGSAGARPRRGRWRAPACPPPDSRCRGRRPPRASSRKPGQRARLSRASGSSGSEPGSCSAAGASMPVAARLAPAPTVVALQHSDRAPSLRQAPGHRQADQAGADHDDVGCALASRRTAQASPAVAPQVRGWRGRSRPTQSPRSAPRLVCACRSGDEACRAR